jgi:alpha-beta hydrolase superfamily lysophospholipase
MNSTEQQLCNLVQTGHFAEAKKVIEVNLHQAHDSREQYELLELLAYINLQLGRPTESLKALQNLPTLSDANEAESTRSRVITLKRTGDIYLRMGRKSNAATIYKSALSSAMALAPSDPIVTGILEALVGSLLHDEQYEAARPYAEQLVSIHELRINSDEPFHGTSLFWAYVKLLQIYRTISAELHLELLRKALPFFDRMWLFRSQHFEGQSPEKQEATFEELRQGMFDSYISENTPATFLDRLWLSTEYKMRALPLINWQPADKVSNAVILCVHGLGLENRVYDPFGTQMAARHFTVYAMDVRGFGAWQSQYGSETVNFSRALSDVSAIIHLIKTKHPGLPVFLLGESMGGAIVLRFAADFESEIAGVISSAPPAQRFGEIRTAAQVALHLFSHPYTPFDIGTQLAEQATSRAELRDLWKRDPKAKTQLSPVELIMFDHFVKETQARCSSIHSTPVMIVQGMADRLVNPKGSYDMYDSVRSPDKTMMIIGNAEHLIFENLEQSPVLLDGLTTWLNHHITPSSTATIE